MVIMITSSHSTAETGYTPQTVIFPELGCLAALARGLQPAFVQYVPFLSAPHQQSTAPLRSTVSCQGTLVPVVPSPRGDRKNDFKSFLTDIAARVARVLDPPSCCHLPLLPSILHSQYHPLVLQSQ